MEHIIVPPARPGDPVSAEERIRDQVQKKASEGLHGGNLMAPSALKFELPALPAPSHNAPRVIHIDNYRAQVRLTTG